MLGIHMHTHADVVGAEAQGQDAIRELVPLGCQTSQGLVTINHGLWGNGLDRLCDLHLTSGYGRADTERPNWTGLAAWMDQHAPVLRDPHGELLW